MRVLLRPVLIPELGLVLLKPGRESMQVFHNPRVLVEPEPKSMRGLPSGIVPAVRQQLVEDKTLLPFFSNARVIRAAGGAGALSDWLLRHIKSCQWPHGDYHHSETVIHRYGTGAMVLCWHCDNQLRDQTSESLEQLAHQNLSAWMIDVIGHAISGGRRATGGSTTSFSGVTCGKNPLGVPRKRHRTGRADHHQHTETAHKKSCAAASRPPAKPATGKDGGQHCR